MITPRKPSRVAGAPATVTGVAVNKTAVGITGAITTGVMTNLATVTGVRTVAGVITNRTVPGVVTNPAMVTGVIAVTGIITTVSGVHSTNNPKDLTNPTVKCLLPVFRLLLGAPMVLNPRKLRQE